jgi:hypothetical protein
MKIIIDFAVREFKYPFKDPRPEYSEISSADLLIVSATVIKILKNDLAKCRLENEVEALIHFGDLGTKT